MEKINQMSVFYGQGEYTSHVTNDAMALHYATMPEYRVQWPLLVETVEHAGWIMVHFFDEAHPNGICVGTANDRASWQPEQQRIREALFNTERNIIGDIRRPARQELI